MSYTIPTLDDLRKKGLSVVSNTLDKSENAMIYDGISACAVVCNEILFFARKEFEKMDINNNSGDDLDKYVYQRTGITRTEAVKANGKCRFIGTQGTLIPQYFVITNGDKEFQTRYGDVITEQGYVDIDVEAVIGGNIGKIPAHTITIIKEKLNGLDSVDNQSEISGGYDAASDTELRQAYWDYYQDKATSNNPAHYKKWAMEVPGVGQARVIRAYNGPLSVQVIILNDFYQSANEELLAKVKAHIESRQSFDVRDLSVISATPVLLNIQTQLVLFDGYDDAAVKKQIKINIEEWLSRYIDPQYVRTSVSYFEVAGIIAKTDGVKDITSFLLNGGTTNIPISETQVAEVGVVS